MILLFASGRRARVGNLCRKIVKTTTKIGSMHISHTLRPALLPPREARRSLPPPRDDHLLSPPKIALKLVNHKV
jgi:hypothetical protein